MALYTSKPTPVFVAQQINTPEDGEAWVASLTPGELVSGNRSFTNVRIEIVEDTVWLRYTDTSEVGSENYSMDTDVGGYALAITNGQGINLWVESAEQFDLRYQPYVEPLV